MQPSKSIVLRAVLAVLLAWPALAQALNVGTVNVSHSGSITVLKVSTEGKAEPTVSALDGNKALIVVPGGTRSAMAPLKVKSGILQGIRFGSEGGDLRIVADLKQAGVLRLGKVSAQGFEVEISAAPAVKAETKAKGTVKAEAKPEAAENDLAALNPASAGYTYRLVDLALGGDTDQGELVISSDGPASYKSSLKEDGKLLSLSFRNSSLAWTGDGAKLADASVAGVSVRQASEGGEALVKVDVRFREKLAYNLKRDQNQLVVRFGRPEARQTAPKKGDLDALVSIDVEDADVVSVLKALCQQAGFEYQFTKDILSKTGTDAAITSRVKERPFREVVDTILAQVTGSYVQEGNILYIGSSAEIADKKTRLPLQQRYYEPKYVSVAQLTKVLTIYFGTLKANLVAMLKADPVNSGRYMLVGTEQDLSDVMEAIQKYDRPQEGEQGVSAENSGGNSTRTQVFHLSYLADGNLITPAIAQLYTDTGDDPAAPFIDAGTRTMVITTKLKYLRKIEKLLARLDIKPEQVNIEGKIVEVDQGMGEQLGINWNANNDPTKAVPSVNTIGPIPATGALNITTLRNGYNISAAIQALVNENHADLVSAPNITVNDNTPAIISTSDTLISQSQTIVPNGLGSPLITTNFVSNQIPLVLGVTPKISRAERRVLMLISFSLSTAVGVPPAGAPPALSTQKADTNVSVASGETAVIGGLVRQNNSDTLTKVPVLGDIPLLGLLFRSKTVNKDKKEVIIFITPTIVEE